MEGLSESILTAIALISGLTLFFISCDSDGDDLKPSEISNLIVKNTW